MLQNYARKCGIAVDRLLFDYKLMDNLDPATVNERPHEGCYVNGIFLEGSRWDRERHLLVLKKFLLRLLSIRAALLPHSQHSAH